MRVTTDETGRRVAGSVAPNAAAPIVHVIGGSYVFGSTLDDEATIPARLQTLLGRAYRVVNDGVPGYGPFAYRDLSLSIPARDISIILLSEGTDLRAAYSPSSPNDVRCGYLVPRDSLMMKMPCVVLGSGIVRAVGYLHAAYGRSAVPLPPNYDSGSTFAARVLAARVRRLLGASKRRAAAHLILTYVPWDGALERSHLSRYAQDGENISPSVAFEDEAGVSNALRSAAGERFTDEGSLTPLGADIVARALASEVVRRERSR